MKQAKKIQYITDENGNKKYIVLPVETYEEMLEDIKDLAAIAEQKDEPSISFEELRRNL